jgi:hypothetical protein
MRRRDGFPSVVNTLGVASLEESIGQVEGAGGSVVVPPMPIPDMGRVAYCADPAGTVFGLFESAPTG